MEIVEINLDAPETEIEALILYKNGKRLELKPGAYVIFERGEVVADHHTGIMRTFFTKEISINRIVRKSYCNITVEYTAHFKEKMIGRQKMALALNVFIESLDPSCFT